MANLKTEVTRNRNTPHFPKNNISYPPPPLIRTCKSQGHHGCRSSVVSLISFNKHIDSNNSISYFTKPNTKTCCPNILVY